MPVSLHLINAEKKEKRPSARPLKEKEPFLTEPHSGKAPPSIGKNHRILVVDDNPVVLKAFELKLKADGFVVSTTANGALVARTAEEAKAELIVLDINLPAHNGIEWNGFTVMQWLRRFPELVHIPVILISGTDTAQCKEKALKAGAIGFFEKPIQYRALLSAILAALANSSPH